MAGALPTLFDKGRDAAITSALWVHFSGRALSLYVPRYLAATLLFDQPDVHFQQLNTRFFKGFFDFIERIIPGVELEIDPAIPDIRSSVVVCNHRSYLDPILVVSLLSRLTTVVRPDFFDRPLFGWILRHSGFLPGPDRETGAMAALAPHLDEIRHHLAAGGNLIIFPEGTRSRDGRLAPFHKGAFALARICQAPLELLSVSGTGRLFAPGRFLFNTGQPLTLSLSRLGTIPADQVAADLSVRKLTARVRKIYRDAGL